jgi:hypothetical protein
MSNDKEKLNEKDIEIGGKVVGFSTTIKMSVKTTLWIMGVLWFALTGLYGYTFLDMKKSMKDTLKEQNEWVLDELNIINDKLIETKIDVESIKGDVKLILDRQTRDNPVTYNPYVNVNPQLPPSVSDSVN